MPEASGPWAAEEPGAAAPFGFVQFEFGRLLGPSDGSYLVRDDPDAPPLALLLLATLGAPERRRLRGRRGRPVDYAQPEPVPTGRATVVRPQPFASDAVAESWLAQLRRDPSRAEVELHDAARIVNRALHAYRVAAADPYAADVSPQGALAARVGFGSGEALAAGRGGVAWQLPRPRAARARRSMQAPDERFAALLGGRESALAAEELVLRARLDLDAGRVGEAALGALAALDDLLAGRPAAADAAALEAARGALAAAAGAARGGSASPASESAVAACVTRMEAVLRRAARHPVQVRPPN